MRDDNFVISSVLLQPKPTLGKVQSPKLRIQIVVKAIDKFAFNSFALITVFVILQRRKSVRETNYEHSQSNSGYFPD